MDFSCKKTVLQTSDGVALAADYYPAAGGTRGAVLMHMMPSNRVSWRVFAVQLAEAGCAAVAVDLRGHGESAGGPDGYRSFTDAQHQASLNDVAAGVDFLRAKGIQEIICIGASIGANLALRFGADHPEVAGVILLSPGLHYGGIDAVPLAQKLNAQQAVYLVAARDDGSRSGNAAVMAQEIFDACAAQKKIMLFDTGGHGTDMFSSHSELMETLLEWLGGSLRKHAADAAA
ncbi:MAG: alpha/beta fold hydrolase [bacterium]|nr:alpha/beta fold hydrolase [bacterium]